MLRLTSRVPACANAPPTLGEALEERLPAADPILSDTQLLWGPISMEVAALAKMWAPCPTATVLLRPCIPADVREAALREVPDEVLPRPSDDVASLVERLSQSHFLEDSHVLRHGSGPQRVRLNATSYPQPRRRSWSLVVEQAHEDEDGDNVRMLMNYTAYGRLPSDWEAEPMPRAVYQLGLFLWHVSWSVLTPASQRSPPTGCQLLLYYVLFGSAMGRHRDNYTHEMMSAVVRGERSLDSLVEGSHHGADQNSQQVGSNVLVWTEGDASMAFTLSFPSDGDSKVRDYVIHPSYTVSLGAGTLLVFSPVDDVFFCHEAAFLSDEHGTHRMAFVYRWLTAARKFYVKNNKHKLSERLEEQARDRKRRKQAKRAAEVRDALRR